MNLVRLRQSSNFFFRFFWKRFDVVLKSQDLSLQAVEHHNYWVSELDIRFLQNFNVAFIFIDFVDPPFLLLLRQLRLLFLFFEFLSDIELVDLDLQFEVGLFIENTEMLLDSFSDFRISLRVARFLLNQFWLFALSDFGLMLLVERIIELLFLLLKTLKGPAIQDNAFGGIGLSILALGTLNGSSQDTLGFALGDNVTDPNMLLYLIQRDSLKWIGIKNLLYQVFCSSWNEVREL